MYLELIIAMLITGLLACFLIYVTVIELNAALGRGRLADLLFRHPAD